MALAFAPAAFRLKQLRINNPQVVTKSYPSYWEDIKAAGFALVNSEK
jgi:3-phosphoshikimate 1-carboxyvinyltransferase